MLWQILSLPIQILCLCPSGFWLLRLKKTYVFYLLSFKFATEHKSWILTHSFPEAISSACPRRPKINRWVTVQRELPGTKIQHKWKISVQKRNVQSKKNIGWYQILSLPHWSGILSSHFPSIFLHLTNFYKLFSSLLKCHFLWKAFSCSMYSHSNPKIRWSVHSMYPQAEFKMTPTDPLPHIIPFPVNMTGQYHCDYVALGGKQDIANVIKVTNQLAMN